MVSDKQIPSALTITLRKPVSFAGQTYDELRLKEPTVSQFQKLEGRSPVEAATNLIWAVSGVPLGALDQIGARDLGQANRFLERFCQAFPATKDPADDLTIKLEKPIPYDEDTLFELKLREPLAGELKKVEALEGVAEMVQLIHLVSGAPVDVIERLPLRVYRAAESYLQGFL